MSRTTPAVHLLPMDANLVECCRNEPEAFEAEYGATLGESAGLVSEVIEQTMALLERAPRADRWGGYLAVDEQGSVVGTCAFKDAPNGHGVVEIAYFTFPAFENRGYATAMAQALVELAFESPAVQRVIAHTLPEPNASTRVLTKVGLQFVGDVVDPEDGPVWQWETPRRN